jgi:hypothetical protein
MSLIDQLEDENHRFTNVQTSEDLQQMVFSHNCFSQQHSKDIYLFIFFVHPFGYISNIGLVCNMIKNLSIYCSTT